MNEQKRISYPGVALIAGKKFSYHSVIETCSFITIPNGLRSACGGLPAGIIHFALFRGFGLKRPDPSNN
jgi:hypothetical protein